MVLHLHDFSDEQSKVLSKSYSEVLLDLLSGDLNFHNEASDYGSHNFHSFPAKFPPQLPQAFIKGLTQPGDVVLDPMVGSGTSVLEAYLAGRRAYGFDIDPLALRITRVKTMPISPVELLQTGQTILNKARGSVEDNYEELQEQLVTTFDEPTLEFFDHWFLPQTQIELLALLREIRALDDQRERTFFEVCFSAIIITKSGGISLALDLGHTRPHLAKKVIDKTGRVVYGVESEAKQHSIKIARSVFGEFEKRIRQNVAGVPKNKGEHFETKVNFGNAQSLPLEENSVDLIVTSPPYASNAIDYMRAHKFSLTWLGYAIKELGQKRKEYIGGEATTNFCFEQLPLLPQQIVQTLRDKDVEKSLVLHRYYSEMTRVLREMFRVLKSGKASIVVVGNSIMRDVDTQTAQCLADIGSEIGFKVPKIGIRYLDRDKRMMPAGGKIDKASQIQQRMHEEYVIGFYKP